MKYKLIDVTEQNGIIELTLNRAKKHNAINAQMISELTHAITTIDPQSHRVMLLTANGDSFSAGADLESMQQMVAFSQQENFQDAMQLANLLKALYDCPIPTIALVNGVSFGGALGLIACCDFAIASDNAQFCFSEVKLGLVPAVISPYIINCIGAKLARQYFLTAELFNAEIAQQIGLVMKVVERDELEDHAMELVTILMQNKAKALTECKKLVNEVTMAISQETIELTAKRIADIRVTPEAQKALNAFLGKKAGKN